MEFCPFINREVELNGLTGGFRSVFQKVRLKPQGPLFTFSLHLVRGALNQVNAVRDLAANRKCLAFAVLGEFAFNACFPENRR